MRYTFHGGGPCDGALNGAVMPVPLSSGSAGHPSSAHAFATRATVSGSVTRAASPSTTTSASRTDRAIEQRGWRSTLRLFRVPVPVWNQNEPSSQMAPTAVTCGVPSSLTVASHFVRALCASGSGAEPVSSFSTMASQSTGGSPSAAPRLMISMTVSPFFSRLQRATACRGSDVHRSAKSSRGSAVPICRDGRPSTRARYHGSSAPIDGTEPAVGGALCCSTGPPYVRGLDGCGRQDRGMPNDISIDESYDDYPRIEDAFQRRLDESLQPRGPESLWELVATLAPTPGASIVDVGCGEGGDTIELARRVRPDGHRS
jgi:hypothetical protein